jgi:hypothetical protein
MVAGFCDANFDNDAIIARFADAKGIIGEAAKAARYAYDRNVWARYWFAEMCRAQSVEDYWAYEVLFKKIVDARFTIWEREFTRIGEPIHAFELPLRSWINNRYERWKTLRKSKLFGSNVPEPIFVRQIQSGIMQPAA